MPFKSKAQQRFMFAAEARGEVPKGTAQEWADATKKQKGGFKALPEKVKPMKKSATLIAEEIVKRFTPKTASLGIMIPKEAASTCSTPGEKIRSQGQGQGLARGGGKGPMGRPKLTSSEIADKVLEGKKKAETP